MGPDPLPPTIPGPANEPAELPVLDEVPEPAQLIQPPTVAQLIARLHEIEFQLTAGALTEIAEILGMTD